MSPSGSRFRGRNAYLFDIVGDIHGELPALKELGDIGDVHVIRCGNRDVGEMML